MSAIGAVCILENKQEFPSGKQANMGLAKSEFALISKSPRVDFLNLQMLFCLIAWVLKSILAHLDKSSNWELFDLPKNRFVQSWFC